MTKKFIVSTLITFVFFFIEAMFHFNIGKNGDSDKLDWHFPSRSELFKIVVIVFIVAFLSEITTREVIKYYNL